MQSGWWGAGGVKVMATMVIVQVACAGVNVFYKLAAVDGMNLRILLSYRFLFSFAFLGPFSFFLERKKRPKLTWTVLGQAFLCGLLGGSLSQNLFLEGLVLTSVTFASAMANLIPAITFLLAVCFRLEKLALGTLAGKAKVTGTLVGIAGAMVLTFYKGLEISLWSTNFHIYDYLHPNPVSPPPPISSGTNQVLGALLCLSSSITFAGWFIMQAKMSKNYPCHYSSTALMSLMASVQSVMFSLLIDRNWNDWKLGWNIRLLSVSYTGIISGLMIGINTWCVHLRGPLFVSAFSPLMLIIVVIVGSLTLDEKLHLGSVLGGVLIILGLYIVLWGKMKEIETINKMVSPMSPSDHKVVEIVSTTSLSLGDKESKDKDDGNAMELAPSGHETVDLELLHKKHIKGRNKI